MLQKNIFVLTCLLCLASCNSCPEHNSPTVFVTFQGDFKIKKVYGIGGGRVFSTERDTTSAGEKKITYTLELAATRDTTAYVIEQEAGKDTLAMYHTHEAYYEKACGFYMVLKRLEVRFPATTLPKEKINAYNSYISITK